MIVWWVAVATLVMPAAVRSMPPRASDAVLTAHDVPGASFRSESPSAWIAELPRALRTSVRGVAQQQLVTAHAPTRSVLARAVVFSSSSSAARAVAVFRKQRSLKLDAAALDIPPKALKSASTSFWRHGSLVGEFVYAGSTPTASAKVAAAFVALLRSRVAARDAETVWSDILATAAAQRTVTTTDRAAGVRGRRRATPRRQASLRPDRTDRLRRRRARLDPVTTTASSHPPSSGP